MAVAADPFAREGWMDCSCRNSLAPLDAKAEVTELRARRRFDAQLRAERLRRRETTGKPSSAHDRLRCPPKPASARCRRDRQGASRYARPDRGKTPGAASTARTPGVWRAPGPRSNRGRRSGFPNRFLRKTARRSRPPPHRAGRRTRGRCGFPVAPPAHGARAGQAGVDKAIRPNSIVSALRLA